jgi:RNA polymerase sigma factor (TIGR02999 family)
MSEVTQLLDAVVAGDAQAANRLLPLVYDELRRLAKQKLAHEHKGHSLQATALVHEAYVRLVGNDPDQPWNGRGHFFGAAAEAMRRILVESARRRRAIKHGGELSQQELNDELIAAPEPREDLIALDEALDKLARRNREAAELVQLRYFAGLTLPDAADSLGMAPRSAGRLWAYARAWLRREIECRSAKIG